MVVVVEGCTLRVFDRWLEGHDGAVGAGEVDGSGFSILFELKPAGQSAILVLKGI